MQIIAKSIGINEIYLENKKRIANEMRSLFIVFWIDYLFILSIASAVCDISDAIVIGPTPPGTGV